MKRTPLALIVLAVLLSGCMSMKEPLRPVAHVDLPRYMGDWYVIGEIPYFAEKDCVDSIESYALRAKGGIDNWFRCRKKSFDAPLKRKASARISVVDTESNAVWRVWFLGFIPVKYVILDLDPGYKWVAVGHPSRRYGWIMSRDKTLDEATYQRILRDLGTQGYDTTKFQKVPQSPDGSPDGSPTGSPTGAASRIN